MKNGYSLICWDVCVDEHGEHIREVKTIACHGTCDFCGRENVCCGYVFPLDLVAHRRRTHAAEAARSDAR